LNAFAFVFIIFLESKYYYSLIYLATFRLNLLLSFLLYRYFLFRLQHFSFLLRFFCLLLMKFNVSSFFLSVRVFILFMQHKCYVCPKIRTLYGQIRTLYGQIRRIRLSHPKCASHTRSFVHYYLMSHFPRLLI
jgi:hypothetical protein